MVAEDVDIGLLLEKIDNVIFAVVVSIGVIVVDIIIIDGEDDETSDILALY